MPKPARKSQTARAIYTRQWREDNYKNKRFNKPLRECIQLKYNGIYDEYCLFFKSLDEQHPTAKDLTKTQTYRKWKKELLNHESSESEDEQNSLPVEAGDRPELDIIDDRIEPRIDPAELDIIDDRIEPRIDPAEPDILTAAVQEILSPPNEININEADNMIEFNINEVDNIIEEIMNDLEQDDAIRDLLNEANNDELVHPQYQDEDEGIGLNLKTELEDIIEPFDYNLEVEGFDF